MRRIDETSRKGETELPVGVASDEVLYPECDGQPMADNTEQFEWIVSIKQNLEAIFAERDDVFVAGDLLWYPVEGDAKTRVAPDALVVFGRPKGYRGSYLQWHEGDVAPQVVFEVLSPGNTMSEMTRKLRFYEWHGVEEYYVVAPREGEVTGWRREGAHLVLVDEINGWMSPRLGIRFEFEADRITLRRPDGQPFEDFVAVTQERDRQRLRAEQSEDRAERLAAKLRDLGIDPDQL